MRIILYLNLFHQLAILALVEVAKVQCFFWVACFGIDALSMPVVLSSILVARLFVIIFFFRKELLLSTTTTVYKRTSHFKKADDSVLGCVWIKGCFFAMFLYQTQYSLSILEIFSL
jgi:hypothetical protein